MEILTNFLTEVLKFIYDLTGKIGVPNYGLAIILFTIAVKAVLFPLTYKQVRSMRKMQEMQPKIQNMQKKYKGNPQKSQEEMMKLYREEGVNPLSGCLPPGGSVAHIIFSLRRAKQLFPGRRRRGHGCQLSVAQEFG